MNVSQDTIALRLSDEGKKRFLSPYLLAYLTSAPGLMLMGRFFQGNVQEHLGLSDAAGLLVPEYSPELQQIVATLVLQAEEARKAALSAMRQAEADLLDALDLADWSPPEPLTYTCFAADVHAAGRLDSQYYMLRRAR